MGATINADKLTSEIGLAIAGAINKHVKAAGLKNEIVALRWQAELTHRSGDVLDLSEW